MTFEQDRKRFPGMATSKAPKKGKKVSLPHWQKDLNAVLEGFDGRDCDEDRRNEDEEEE